jgi:hypothetical protein
LKNEKIEYFTKLTITDKKIINPNHKINSFFHKIEEAKIPYCKKKILNFYKENIGSIRLFNSILRSGNDAIKKEYDFIIYLNSGSWILNFKEIKKLINYLKKNKKVVGTRILGYLRGKAFFFDDHFLIVNLKQAKKFNFYNIKPDSRPFLPLDFYYGAIHKNLFTWFSILPKSKVYLYSCLSKSFDEYGNLGSKFIPLSYDYKFNLLHSNIRYEKILPLRYAYLKKFKYISSNLFIEKKIQNWKSNSLIDIKYISGSKKVFYVKQGAYAKFKKKIVNFIVKRFIDIGLYSIAKLKLNKIS